MTKKQYPSNQYLESAATSMDFAKMVSAEAVVVMAKELLALRKAFERPDCWEIAGCIFSTEEEALKPGFRGTPEPLYSRPDLTE